MENAIAELKKFGRHGVPSLSQMLLPEYHVGILSHAGLAVDPGVALAIRPPPNCTSEVRMNNGCFAGESVVCPNIPPGAWLWEFGALFWSLLGRGTAAELRKP